MRVMTACLGTALAAATAHGHGGPPRTTDVRFTKRAPDTVLMATNLGLMITHDGGCTVEWICERNVGFLSPFVPKYAMTDDGAILVTTKTGLRVSRDGGCNFTTQGPALWSDALTVGPTGEVWIATSENPGTNDVYVSSDNGETFTARGLTSTTIAYRSIRVAPSDPSRVYVTGDSLTSAHLYHLGGELPATGIARGTIPRLEVAAIDPADPDTLFVISRDVTTSRDDRLYRSTDGGLTFVEVFGAGMTIYDVVLGATTYVTTRVPYEDKPYDVGGPVFSSSNGGMSFTHDPSAPVLMCLGASPIGTLVGCGANWEPDFMALTALVEGTWTKRWRFTELAAPVACPEGSGNRECDGEWTQLEIDLGLTGPTCGPLATDNPPIEYPRSPPEGCGCATTTRAPVGLVLLVAWRLRRRRQR
jgi:hypothetical protein